MTSVVIVTQPYPAAAHFDLDTGERLVIETQAISLNFLDVGVPGPRGPAGTSLSLTGNFSYGDATPDLIGTFPAGLYNPDTRIDIVNIFNGFNASISIGSLIDPELVMAQSDCNTTEPGSYQVASALVLGTDTEIYLFIQPGAGATQGTGRFWLDLV